MFEIHPKKSPPAKLSQSAHSYIIQNREILNYVFEQYKEAGLFKKSSEIKIHFGKGKNDVFEKLTDYGMLQEQAYQDHRLLILNFGGFLYCSNPNAKQYLGTMYRIFDLLSGVYAARGGKCAMSFEEVCAKLYPMDAQDKTIQHHLRNVFELLSAAPYSISNLGWALTMSERKGQLTNIEVIDRIFEFQNADDYFERCYEALTPRMGYIGPVKLEAKDVSEKKEKKTKEKVYRIKKINFKKQPRKSSKQYKCFVVMPIGEKATQEYRNNMKVFDLIIKPCVMNSGYNIECTYSDLIMSPGVIPHQIIHALRDSDIVVADLRRQNPNVIWELGVRQALGKRSIMICSDHKEVFFDTGTYRIPDYKINGRSNQDFYEKLSSFVDDVIQNPTAPDNPVMHNFVLSGLSQKRMTNLHGFEQLIEEAKWRKEYIGSTLVWICDEDNTFQIDPSGEGRQFEEDWTDVYPDKTASFQPVVLKINQTPIKEVYFVCCDGGRILVPLPRRVMHKDNEGYHYEWSRSSLQFKIAKIISEYYIYENLEGVARKSKIEIVE